MMKTFTKICLIIMTTGYVTADSCEVTAPDQTLSQNLATGAMDFSVNLFSALKNGTTNMFFSPFSVRVSLAMTAEGAGGTTLVQMIQALQLEGFTSKTEIDQAFQQYLGSFCSNNNYALSTANRIYVQKGFTINPTFTQTLSQYFKSDAVDEDFGTDPSGAATAINDWVEQQTNNTIKDLFSADSFTPAPVLILVNAIYFKGTWQVKFDPENTEDGPFTLACGKIVQVPIMRERDWFMYYYSSALQSQVLQLNYSGNHLAMHIVLPAEGVSLSTVQENLNFQNIIDVISNCSSEKVMVSLPKFKANFKQELNAPLKSMGMVDVFDPSNADLSGIAPSTSNENLYVSSVIHEAYVAVDEEGTEAAAAGINSLVPRTLVGNEPVVFDVNRPCIYFISDLKFSQILFMGILDDPSVSS